jgi:S1-C subfamily serine protease
MLAQLSNDIADIVESAAPSVVQVQGSRRPASGLVHSPDIVVTTLRAIRSEDGLRVRDPQGRELDAEMVGWDPATSLAVLRAPDLQAAALVPSPSAVRVGHFGVAIARSWSNAVTASAGTIAIIGGPLQTGPRRAIEQVFRTTAPMHDGFAGGAFLDSAGGLIGVATSSAIRGLGVVIPASIAWKAAADVLAHGRVKRGYLGIVGQPAGLADHQRKTAAGRERALLILGVKPGGAAADAGLLVGDVLLAVDESPIESPEELLDFLSTAGAGHTARLHLLRGGAPMQLTVKIGDRPPR